MLRYIQDFSTFHYSACFFVLRPSFCLFFVFFSPLRCAGKRATSAADRGAREQIETAEPAPAGARRFGVGVGVGLGLGGRRWRRQRRPRRHRLRPERRQYPHHGPLAAHQEKQARFPLFFLFCFFFISRRFPSFFLPLFFFFRWYSAVFLTLEKKGTWPAGFKTETIGVSFKKNWVSPRPINSSFKIGAIKVNWLSIFSYDV